MSSSSSGPASKRRRVAASDDAAAAAAAAAAPSNEYSGRTVSREDISQLSRELRTQRSLLQSMTSKAHAPSTSAASLAAAQAKVARLAASVEAAKAHAKRLSTLKGEITTRRSIESCPRRLECPNRCHQHYLGIGPDGHFGHCSAVYDKAMEEWKHCDGEGPSINCCGCPRLFHEGCLPIGHMRKQSLDDPEAFEYLCDLCAPVGWQALNEDVHNRGYDDVTDDEDVTTRRT